jgi:Zn-dependent protease
MLGDPIEWLRQIAIWLPIFVLSITLHEFGHAASAYLLGDDTAKRAGRLTLNPGAHLDPLGTLMVVFVHFGWAKPVPVTPSKLRWPRLGNVLVSVAGPFMNLLLALATGLYIKYGGFQALPPGAQEWIFAVFGMNVILMVFNLLPIPPLDGGHVLEALMPRRWLPAFHHMVPYATAALLVIVLVPQLSGGLGTLFHSVQVFMLRTI